MTFAGDTDALFEALQTQKGSGSKHIDEPTENELIAKRPRPIEPVGQGLDSFSTEVEEKLVAAAPEDDTAETGASPISLTHEVRHEVSFPDDYPYVPLSEHRPPDKAAREYPFVLDPFQQLSIACIERNESVLVSAHTSAGKTVVAEYAIAKALQQHQRVIYTSPIKALSNQKYRELNEIFGDVGLMTGDVTINNTASCLVMTTEILRSMLYRGSEIMREVAWVVFDEIHYMRDKERGVVWEETLILLPDNIRFVFLSATIPNARQFARWVCSVHKQPCHVVYTNFRPTPLQHYLFPASANGIYLVVDEKGIFREDNFQKALNVFGDKTDEILGEKKKRRAKTKGGSNGGPSDISKIIKMVMSKNLHPAIVFSFSKKDCEALAIQVAKMDLNTEDERRLVANVFSNAIESLAEEDRQLPQISSILPLLKNGIGIHHSGLLPLLKEVIEILFQEGLLKLLFATETFSIGLNMPARTVIFTNARKFDGQDFRWLSSGEYIQMSGRAGRRGLDSRGIVILMVEEKMDPLIAKNMLKGQADPLNSAFHLSYNMILNLMRVEGVSPDFMLERSFFQFQSADDIPTLETKLFHLETDYKAIVIEQEEKIAEYWNIRRQLDNFANDMRKVIHHYSFATPFLQVGRLVRVKDGSSDYGWCAVINLHKKMQRSSKKDTDNKVESAPQFVVDVLAYCEKPKTEVQIGVPKPCPPGVDGEMIVLPVTLGVLDGISSVRIYMPKDIRSADQRYIVYRAIHEVKKRFPDGPPLLDPVNDMGIKDEAFIALVRKIESLETVLFSHPLHRSSMLPRLYDQYAAKKELLDRLSMMKRQIRDAKAIVHMDELKNRKRLLRRLGYTTEDDVIEMKGRVACEISTGDETLLTELIFAGAFNDLSSEQTASLLSCFVFEEKSDEPVRLKEELAAPLRMLQESARRIAKVSMECKLDLNEEDYVAKFRPELMEVVYAWCKGAKFAKICKMTEIYEGSIIRCMRRLEELLRQMAQAANSIGNSELELKFTEGINKLKRDIVFANIAGGELIVSRFLFWSRQFSSRMAPKDVGPPITKPLLGRPSNNLKMGIVGLPNVGKSTFFNAITNSAARAENFPFCTIDPEEARVAVPDTRFDWLCAEYKPASKIPAYLTVIDIAGLVKGAAAGQGLGNAFLSHIRAVDGIFHMVRAFGGEEIVHVEGDVDPTRDLDIIREELCLKDIEFLTKSVDGAKKGLRGHENDKTRKFELDTLEKLLNWVEVQGREIRHGDWSAKEIEEIINPLQLLTAKSAVYLVNVSEEDFIKKKNKWLPKIKAWIDKNSAGDPLIPFSGTLEHRLSTIEPDDKEKYLLENNNLSSAMPKIILAGYHALQLIYYFTAGADEVRAWTIRRGVKAPQAAGVIHTDFERGFIMAEVMHFNDLKELGDETSVRAAGKYLQKGRDYVVEDGDIVYFKFNVGSGKKK